MDHIKFAQLVSFISVRRSDSAMDKYELNALEMLASDCFPQSSPAVYPVYPYNRSEATILQTRELLRAIAENRKIDAMKIYRTLTGDGLREVKDAVEAAMNPGKVAVQPWLNDPT